MHGRPAQDYMGKPIAVGDIVDLQDGKLKGRGGTVKYVVRGMLFLHVRCAPPLCWIQDPGFRIHGVYQRLAATRTKCMRLVPGMRYCDC